MSSRPETPFSSSKVPSFSPFPWLLSPLSSLRRHYSLLTRSTSTDGTPVSGSRDLPTQGAVYGGDVGRFRATMGPLSTRFPRVGFRVVLRDCVHLSTFLFDRVLITSPSRPPPLDSWIYPTFRVLRRCSPFDSPTQPSLLLRHLHVSFVNHLTSESRPLPRPT